MKTVQEEVRWSLTKYALLPVLLLMLVGLVLVGASWKHYVADLSDERRTVAAEVLANEIHDYEERAMRVKQMHIDPAALRLSGEKKAELYAYLYHEVNIAHDGTAFFLLDAKQNIVLGNRDMLPDYLMPFNTSWGMLHRLTKQEGPAAEFVQRADGFQDLVIGSSLDGDDGQLQGYILFFISAEYLQKNIASPYLDFVLEDGFGNVCLQTGGDYVGSSLHKMAVELHGSDHELTSFHKQQYYVTSAPLPAGDFTLYTIMPVSGLLQRYALGIGILLAVLAFLIPILLVSIRRESQARARAIAEEEARAVAISEVRRLESQFNPHFLFNTLENIKFMVRLDPEAAQRMLVDLSQLLRYSIKGKERFVELVEDLAYTHSYIEIQKYRFGKRLVYQEDISEDVYECLVPRLIFQPVIENAIRYGISADGVIRVAVTAARQKGNLKVTVQDQGLGLPEKRLQEIRQMLSEGADPAVHTGIYNIHRRLQLLYGRSYGLKIDCPAEGGTLIVLTLPSRKEGIDI
ncbi:MAG: HATPase-c domain-containing protein [Mitsuokella multacida]|jgi:signal transduction histidine kinase